MGSGRVLVIIGVIVLVGAVVVGVVLWRRTQQPEPTLAVCRRGSFGSS